MHSAQWFHSQCPLAMQGFRAQIKILVQQTYAKQKKTKNTTTTTHEEDERKKEATKKEQNKLQATIEWQNKKSSAR